MNCFVTSKQKFWSDWHPSGEFSVISIQSPPTPWGEGSLTPIDERWTQSIVLEFHDILPDDTVDRPYTLFSKEMASELFDFISSRVKRGNEHSFLVHCDAGMSRSVAVGMFIKEYYNYFLHLEVAQDCSAYNVHVFNLLRRQWMQKEG